ncbi:MAG: hypothetical protein JRN67_01645 [Nitrososphaerota archaeon]|nr:hypothetical protein [Nitrososphaerota archaeon]
MNLRTKLGIAIAVVVLIIVFFVPDPGLRNLPTGFCGVYHSLQCQYSTYYSLSAWYSGFGTFCIGGHYFLELGRGITIQIF